MRFTLSSVPSVTLIILPFFVAYNGYGLIVTSILVISWLLIRQTIVVSHLMSRENDTRVILNTLPISHYVEKVRWCLDKLRLDYIEEKDIGIFGVMALGRMVPTLWIPGKQISISNSSDILRYIYALKCGSEPEAVEFLRPTEESLEWERKIDKMGFHLRQYIYYHTLVACKNPDELALKIWGLHDPGIPVWQKKLLTLIQPFLKTYLIRVLDISQENALKGMEKSEKMFKEVDQILNSGKQYILGGDEPTYIDYAFASLAALIVMPDQYGGSALTPESKLGINDIGSKYREAILKFRRSPSGQFIIRLYSEHRF